MSAVAGYLGDHLGLAVVAALGVLWALTEAIATCVIRRRLRQKILDMRRDLDD